MTYLRKLAPAPLTSVALFALWIALARTFTVGQAVLGLCLAVVIPILTQGLRPTMVRVRRPLVIVRYIFTVGYDVLLSNIQVGWGVVRWGSRKPRSKFVIVPLELRDPLGLAALSMVTTVVPGTVWSELALDRSALLLHVWNAEDEPAFVARFKARYEQPLKEIFE